MNLHDFIENYDPQEQIMIMHNDEVVYEGETGKLDILLRSSVRRQSCKIVDGITQIIIWT